MDKEIKDGLKKIGKSSAKLAKVAAVDALNVAGKAGVKIVDVALENNEKRHQKEIERLYSKNPHNDHLWMDESMKTGGLLIIDTFWEYVFYDYSGTVKYTAKGNYDRKKQDIKLFDNSGNVVGEVIEKSNIGHNPLESYPFSGEIKVNGHHIGVAKSAYRKGSCLTFKEKGGM